MKNYLSKKTKIAATTNRLRQSLAMFSLVLAMIVSANFCANAQNFSDADFTVTVGSTPFQALTAPTVLGTGGDDGGYTFQLPFAIRFDDQTFAAGTNMYCSNNGYLQFNTTAQNMTYSNNTVNTSSPYHIRLLSYDNSTNYSWGYGTGISWQVTGTAPNRTLTVQWDGFEVGFNSDMPVQIKFFENANLAIPTSFRIHFGPDYAADLTVNTNVCAYVVGNTSNVINFQPGSPMQFLKGNTTAGYITNANIAQYIVEDRTIDFQYTGNPPYFVYCGAVNGTGVPVSTTTTSYFPYFTYNYARCQAIYTATELGNTTFTINKIAWYQTTSPTAQGNNISILMKHTSFATPGMTEPPLLTTTLLGASHAAEFIAGGWTLVWTGNYETGVPANSWFERVLAIPFQYDGTSNLSVVIVSDDGAWNSSKNRSFRTYTPNNMRHHYNDYLTGAHNAGTLTGTPCMRLTVIGETEEVSDTIPGAFTRRIGWEQQDGGPAIYGNYASNPVGAWTEVTGAPGNYYPADIYPSNAVSCMFPPILDNNSGLATIIYKAEEFGYSLSAGESIEFTQIKIPLVRTTNTALENILMGATYGWPMMPYDLYNASVLTTTNPFNSLVVRGTPVAIMLKNGATFYDREPHDVDTSSNSGWQRVWEHEYQYCLPGIIKSPQWVVENETIYLVLDLDKPFVYTGGDVSMIFSNESANQGRTSTMFTGDTASTSYNMQCFITQDAQVDNTYLGPKFATPTRATVNFSRLTCLGTANAYYQYAWTSFAGVWPYTGVRDPALPVFDLSIPFSDNSAAGNFNHASAPASVRPKIIFNSTMMTIKDDLTEVVAGVPSGIDTAVVMATIVINTENYLLPLRLRALRFTTEGTTPGVTINNVKLYKIPNGGSYSSYNKVLLGTILAEDFAIEEEFNEFLVTDEFNTSNQESLTAINSNTYIIVYEISKLNDCGDELGISVKNYVVDRANKSIDDGEYKKIINQELIVPIQYERVNVVNPDARNVTMCYNVSNIATRQFDLRGQNGTIAGTFTGYQWYKWNEVGGNWEIIPGATNRLYTFAADINYTKLKGVVEHPVSCDLVVGETDSVVFYITYSTPNISIAIALEDKEPGVPWTYDDLSKMKKGDQIAFKVDDMQLGLNSLPIIVWQYNVNGTGWYTIPGSSNTMTLTYILPDQEGDYMVRARLDNGADCKGEVFSSSINFSEVSSNYTFEFVGMPSKRQTLCDGETLNLEVSFAGMIDSANTYWEKDGEPLLRDPSQPNSRANRYGSRFLSLPNRHHTDVGSYRFKATALISKVGPGYEEGQVYPEVFYSEDCKLTILPKIEIYYQSQEKNYARPGDQVVFVVNSSFTYDQDGTEVNPNGQPTFQWYKILVVVKQILNLQIITISMVPDQMPLAIVDVPEYGLGHWEDIYSTNNGGYYYLTITTPCGTANSEKFYLYEGDKLTVSELSSVIICEVGEDATFTISATYDDMTKLRYQWYMNDEPIVDNNRIKGATTNTLSFTPTTAGDLNIPIYCNVFLSHQAGIEINSATVYIEESYMDFVAKDPAEDTLTKTASDIIRFSVDWESNLAISSYQATLFDIDSDEIIETLNVPLQASNKLSFTNYQLSDDDVANLTHKNIGAMIINDCNDIVTAFWTIIIENVDIDSPTTIESSLPINSLSIAPNPVTDVISVSYNTDFVTNTAIELCGLTGSTIAVLFEGALEVGTNNFSFDLSKMNVSTGTYILKLHNSSGTLSKQFLFIK